MPRERKITQALFDAIKGAINQGKTYRPTAEFYGVSFNTVERIAKSESLESYFSSIKKKEPNNKTIITVQRGNDYTSYTKESEVMDIIKKQDKTGEETIQQVLWMTRTIGVTVASLFDIVLGLSQEMKKRDNNTETEMHIAIQNQQRQIELLERMIVQWTT